jgi:uncharacterized protein YndB with AHSA1/START domain
VKLDLVHDVVLRHPVDVVWRALTEAESISDWLMATTDFEPRVGSRFRMKTQRLSASGWVEAEVIELEPLRRMVWAWSIEDGNAPTTVTFELRSDGEDTHLRLTHEGEIDPLAGGLIGDGWPGRIELLRRSLD